jgi:hypothetical protein
MVSPRLLGIVNITDDSFSDAKSFTSMGARAQVIKPNPTPWLTLIPEPNLDEP